MCCVVACVRVCCSNMTLSTGVFSVPITDDHRLLRGFKETWDGATVLVIPTRVRVVCCVRVLVMLRACVGWSRHQWWRHGASAVSGVWHHRRDCEGDWTHGHIECRARVLQSTCNVCAPLGVRHDARARRACSCTRPHIVRSPRVSARSISIRVVTTATAAAIRRDRRRARGVRRHVMDPTRYVMVGVVDTERPHTRAHTHTHTHRAKGLLSSKRSREADSAPHKIKLVFASKRQLYCRCCWQLQCDANLRGDLCRYALTPT
jgi:hypothetical protein